MNTTTPIIAWLVGRVAFYVDLPARTIDADVALAELGIDSVSAVGLCGEIEDRWDLEVDPTLVFDYPTIAAIAAFVAQEIGAHGRSAAPLSAA